MTDAAQSNVRATNVRPMVGDLRQFAGVRRFVLDDGPERGVAVLEFSTGAGLDFWVMADRGLDIGVLRWQGVPVAWQSPQGFMHPSLADVEGDAGRGFTRLLSGFLCTCGLEHVRQPRDGMPLHGRLGMMPARVLSASALWDLPEPLLRVEGEVVQYRQGAENLRLRRVIEAPIGRSELRIIDTVTNDGHAEQVHDLLYHFNIGYPVLRPGSTVHVNEQRLLGPLTIPDAGPLPTVLCVPTDGAGSGAVLTTPLANGSQLRMHMTFSTSTLPWVQFWHDLRPGCGLLAIEPCASQWLPGGASKPLPVLQPNEHRQYEVHIRFDQVTGGVG
jgi:hypothetical protein